MNLIEEVKFQFKHGSPFIRIIVINIAVFLLVGLFELGLFLFKLKSHFSDYYLALNSSPRHLLHAPWTLFTYQFMHSGPFHLLSNMLILYFTGNIFMDFFKRSDAWRVYLLGGLIGGVLYLISNILFPVFSDFNSTLVGASGCIMAILFASATYAPNLRLALFGIIQIKLVWLALLFLFLDLVSIANGNAGGHIAHIGGALFGFLFARYRQGKFHFNLPDININQKPDERQFKVKVKTYHNQDKSINSKNNGNYKPSQEDIDIILDKISKNGYDKLSKQEKEILFKASQE
ncbi:MAG: rhomboid family intramembrane serine protease [bacterium]|nr:rhomboid family intramembrane serine protease [bacterium]